MVKVGRGTPWSWTPPSPLAGPSPRRPSRRAWPGPTGSRSGRCGRSSTGRRPARSSSGSTRRRRRRWRRGWADASGWARTGRWCSGTGRTSARGRGRGGGDRPDQTVWMPRLSKKMDTFIFYFFLTLSNLNLFGLTLSVSRYFTTFFIPEKVNQFPITLTFFISRHNRVFLRIKWKRKKSSEIC